MTEQRHREYVLLGITQPDSVIAKSGSLMDLSPDSAIITSPPHQAIGIGKVGVE